MTYEVRVNGEKVWSTDNRVVRISGQSARGEMFAAGIADTDGVVDLFVEEAVSAGTPRLDEIDDMKQAAIRSVPEGTIVGTPPYEPAADANKPGQTSEDLSSSTIETETETGADTSSSVSVPSFGS